MRHRRSRLTALVCALLAMFTAACGEDSTMQPTMTLDQAKARVEQILREAAAQLPAGAELKPQGAYGEMPCGGFGGEGSSQVFFERQYQVVYPDPWPDTDFIALLETFWKSRGYQLKRDNRNEPDLSALYYTDPSDRTLVGVDVYHRYAGKIDVYLVSDSACVWQDGTPPS